MLTHFSLFTGIGGSDIAAEWAGFETVGQVEWADYPTKVLEKHWPNVPRWRDIHDVRANNVLPIIRTRGGITVLSGGFPCQPFSVAGRQKGKDDDRFLWPEMLRVISELKPTWVIGENVSGFINMGLEDACADLENQGYAVQAFVIPACAVEALHERKRCFIVGYSEHNGRNATEKTGSIGQRKPSNAQGQDSTSEFERPGKCSGRLNILENSRCELWKRSKQQGALRNETGKGYADIIERPSEMVSNTNTERLQGQWEESCGTKQKQRNIRNNGWWESEPDVGRVANGIPSRVDRLKCLGNAIVPQQIYPIFRYIAEIENSKQK